MSARIDPAQPPYSDKIQALFDGIMPPGVAPLTLFTTLANDERLITRFMSGGLLDKGHLTLRQREMVIDRVTAQNKSEYEWGVHVALFAERVELDKDQIYSLVHGGAGDACWSEEEKLLIKLCDALHGDANVDDDLWADLSNIFSDAALIELLLLAGFYRTVSYLTNALRLPLETFSAQFPAAKSV